MSKARYGEELTPEETAFLEADMKGVAPSETEIEDEIDAPEPAGEQPTKEVKTEDAPQENAEKPKKNIKVPLYELESERERRKAIEREADLLRQQATEARRNLEFLRQNAQQPAQQNPAVPENKPPAPDEDPIGAVKYLQQKLTAFEAAAQQSAYEGHLAATTGQYEAAFRQATPDYDEAATYLRESYANEMRAIGTPEPQIQLALRARAFEVAQIALKNNQDPANLFYSLAKSRGYATKSPSTSDSAVVSEAERMAKISLGQKQNISLGQANGAPPAGNLTYEMLAGMSEKEFARISREFPSKVKELMGG